MPEPTPSAEAAATPSEFTVGDKVYRIGGMTVETTALFERWMQQRVIRMARESLTEDMERDERNEVMDAAFRAAQVLSMSDPVGERITFSIDGLSYLLWLMMCEHHPELTPQGVREFLADEKTQEAAMDAFDLVRGRGGELSQKKSVDGASDSTSVGSTG